MNLVKQKSAKLVISTVKSDAEYNVDVIINVIDLAEIELADDIFCYLIRDDLLRVINDDSDFSKLDHVLKITADVVHDFNETVFIVSRNDNILLIDDIAESHEHELSLIVDSSIIKRMRARCETFLSDLKNARLNKDCSFVQNLRFFREHNVRVERELRMRDSSTVEAIAASSSRIVHSYDQERVD